MLEKIKSALNNNTGAVQIVEAAYVFPIMFIVLFFLIYMGNVYYIKCQIEEVVETNAVRGASYCCDPLLAEYKEKGTLPSVDDVDIKPYRYIFGEGNNVAKEVGKKVKNDLDKNYSSFFKNMSPKLETSQNKIAEYHNMIMYSTFSVGVKCSLRMPIRFLGQDSFKVLTITSRSEVPVNDAPEFIRNTDMVIDLLPEGFKDKVSEMFGKINNFLNSFASK